MSLIDRFFGRRAPEEHAPERLVANTAIEHPLSLQLLLSEAQPFDSADLSRALRTFDRSTSAGRCEIDDELGREGKVFGLAGWGRHVVRFLGFDVPMPSHVVEPCIAGAHYASDLKQRAREHRAHVMLGLPDFAAHAAGHHEGQRYFDVFESVLRYVLESGARLSRGHTMQIGTSEYMRLRAPKLDESFLVPNGELFVMEIIGADEINR